MVFWRRLLAYVNEESELHSRISASRYYWLGTRRHGQWWNYVVLQNETRVELYTNALVAAGNKALFYRFHAQAAAVEADFGGPLSWQRVDDKRASCISFTVSGGWVDDRIWNSAIEQSLTAMQKLYGVFLQDGTLNTWQGNSRQRPKMDEPAGLPTPCFRLRIHNRPRLHRCYVGVSRFRFRGTQPLPHSVNPA